MFVAVLSAEACGYSQARSNELVAQDFAKVAQQLDACSYGYLKMDMQATKVGVLRLWRGRPGKDQQ